MSVTEIETLITKLPAREVQELMTWITDYNAKLWATPTESDREKARLAAIDAAMGSMAQWQVTSNDLRRERNEDNMLAERQLQGEQG